MGGIIDSGGLVIWPLIQMNNQEDSIYIHIY